VSAGSPPKCTGHAARYCSSAIRKTPCRPKKAYLAAIAVSKEQKAKSFELRAALALAKLYQSTKRPGAACAILAPALEGFASTPEFPEIAEAQKLLAALAH
jgi:hypothetical protein